MAAAVQDDRPVCECPKCGRQHRLLSASTPPDAIRGGWVCLSDDALVPLHELQADADYLIGRVIADGSCGGMIAASIKAKLAAVEQALTGRLGEK